MGRILRHGGRFLLALLALGLIAGCGIDGPPRHPDRVAQPAGTAITISGDARIGVEGSL